MWEPGILRTVSNVPFFLRGCFRGCQLLPQHPCLAGWEFASGRAAADSQEHTRVLQSPSGNLAGAGMAPEQQRPETLQSQVVTEPCRAIQLRPRLLPAPLGAGKREWCCQLCRGLIIPSSTGTAAAPLAQLCWVSLGSGRSVTVTQGGEQPRGCRSGVGNMEKWSTWKRVGQALILEQSFGGGQRTVGVAREGREHR